MTEDGVMKCSICGKTPDNHTVSEARICTATLEDRTAHLRQKTAETEAQTRVLRRATAAAKN